MQTTVWSWPDNSHKTRYLLVGTWMQVTTVLAALPALLVLVSFKAEEAFRDVCGNHPRDSDDGRDHQPRHRHRGGVSPHRTGRAHRRLQYHVRRAARHLGTRPSAIRCRGGRLPPASSWYHADSTARARLARFVFRDGCHACGRLDFLLGPSRAASV